MVALLEEKHLPAYVKIAGEILKSIEDETFPRDSMLPSERALAERHNHATKLPVARPPLCHTPAH